MWMVPLDDESMSTKGAVEIRELTSGVQISIRAQPGARREGVCGVHAGRLKVAIAAPPDKGKANEAIIRVMASALGLKRSQLAITSGQTSRDKTLQVEGTAVADVRRRIEELLTTSAGGADS